MESFNQNNLKEQERQQLYWLKSKLDNIWEVSRDNIKYSLDELRKQMNVLKKSFESDA
jgi:hypothetical protein